MILLGIGIVIILLFLLDWRIQQLFKWLDQEEKARNTLYPVFSKREIIEKNAEVKLAHDEWDSDFEALEKLFEKETKEDEPFDPSEELKRANKLNIEKSVKLGNKVKEYNFMIEANIAVLNGGKISSFLDEWEERFVISRFEREEKEVKRRYREWEESINKKLKKKKA